MILIIDNFINKAEIDHCLNILNNSKSFDKNFNGRYIISIEKSLNHDIIINSIKKKLLDESIRLSNKKLKIDTAELVIFPERTNHNLHFDKEYDEMTSILYLNNDFRGGETFFEDGTIVSPVPGRALFFNGRTYLHGVNIITKGLRATFSIWYKNE
jgi:hypothetical protein